MTQAKNRADHLLLLAMALAAGGAQAQDRFQISGFGSLVWGDVIRGDGYIANYPNLGLYGRHGSVGFGPPQERRFNPETRLGLQGSATLTDNLRGTVQLISRGTNDYSPRFEWAYMTWEASPQVDVQAGKMRLPVYLYSDKMDVGFAYPWLRVPSDAYSLDSVNYKGARVNYRVQFGDINTRFSLWGGKQEDPNSRLMSYLFDTRIDRSHRFVGLVADSNWGDLQLRVTYTFDRMRQTTPNPAQAFRNENFREEFYDIAFSYPIGNLTLVAEWNKDRPFYQSWYVSGIYQTGAWSFYGVYSRFILDLPWEKHSQQSIGLRRDLGSAMALKLDLTRLRDKGMNPFTGQPNPVIKLGSGHATVATVALDFIF